MSANSLAAVLSDSREGSLRLERSLLRDRATELLRLHIIQGSIPPGTKLVEREVAQMLGISRAPTRDALNDLQKDGLVVAKGNSRYVIELNAQDLRELYTVRVVLERLAAELAARNTSPANQSALLATLQVMEEANKRRDLNTYLNIDLDSHRLIWQQAQNRALLNVLNTMLGPIFLFIVFSKKNKYYDWDRTIAVHRDTITCINSGNAEAAAASMERHLLEALDGVLEVF
jgi:DNA-binding GntR family transcriptional regulator